MYKHRCTAVRVDALTERLKKAGFEVVSG